MAQDTEGNLIAKFAITAADIPGFADTARNWQEYKVKRLKFRVKRVFDDDVDILVVPDSDGRLVEDNTVTANRIMAQNPRERVLTGTNPVVSIRCVPKIRAAITDAAGGTVGASGYKGWISTSSNNVVFYGMAVLVQNYNNQSGAGLVPANTATVNGPIEVTCKAELLFKGYDPGRA